MKDSAVLFSDNATFIDPSRTDPGQAGLVRAVSPTEDHVSPPLSQSGHDNEILAPMTSSIPFYSAAITNVLSQIPGPSLESKGFLLAYLDQLQPTSEQNFMEVMEVITAARSQLMTEQSPALDDMDEIKSKILSSISRKLEGLSERQLHVGTAFLDSTTNHLDNLNTQRNLKRSISLLREPMEGLNMEKESPHFGDRVGDEIDNFLEDARGNLVEMNSTLATVDAEIAEYEKQLAKPGIRSLLGDEHSRVIELMTEYKAKADASLDSEIVITRLENILAAAKHLDLRN